MKIASLVFIILVFLIAFRYTKVFDVNLLIIIGVFFLWFAMVYIKVHLKNKEKNTPSPVYIVNR